MTTTALPHLTGTLLRPGDQGYDDVRQGWNRSARQRPAAVVLAENEADVQWAVRRATADGLAVGVMSTGHGVTAPCDGGVLVNTSRMRDVRVDATRRRATVSAGARWTDLLPRADGHGLAGLPGSSPQVGIVGYTLGGGFGWLGRQFGLSAHHVLRARVVTADGGIVTASRHDHPDLFWGSAAAPATSASSPSSSSASSPSTRCTLATSSTRSTGRPTSSARSPAGPRPPRTG
jgi:FAD/FMN-containing dehydrogenase